MKNQLEKTIYDTIPLAGATQLKVVELSHESINIKAPVANVNSNIHNTAFAGSIYSICALSAWGLMHSRVLSEGIDAEVVIAKAEIRYRLPVIEEISAKCQVPEKDYQDFKARLLENSKARITLNVAVQEDDDLQAEMQANVAVMLLS